MFPERPVKPPEITDNNTNKIVNIPHASPPAALLIEVGSPNKKSKMMAAFEIIPPQEPIIIPFLCPSLVARVPTKIIEITMVGIEISPEIVPESA